MPSLAIGKLPPALLASLLARVPRLDSRVVIGPGIGQDAAVIAMGDQYLVAKTDPITFATDDIGWYAVNVNANDIACMGAHPKWFMATALLPAERTDETLVRKILDQILDACNALGITLVGGHTEITYDLPRPIIVGAMLGEVARNHLVASNGAQVGDVVLLTKGIPLEGTSLIAREKANDLRARGFADDFISRAQNMLFDPGISVVKEALIAADAKLATAMHDPTEGGLATGLRELAHASNVGLEIDETKIPILNEGRVLCKHYGLDPLGTIASGALLIATHSQNAARLTQRLNDANIPYAEIARIVPASEGVMLVNGNAHRPLPQFEVDEITKLFG